MKKYILACLLLTPALFVHSADLFLKNARSIFKIADNQRGVSELFSFNLGNLENERKNNSSLINVGKYKIRATLFIDNNWDIVFVANPYWENEIHWTVAELENGVEYDSGKAKFNLKLKNFVLEISYVENGTKISSKIAYSAILKKLYFGSSEAIFGDIVKYAVIRNRDILTGKNGVMTLRLDGDGIFWYSFYLDDIIANKIQWLVGVNQVLYGMKIRGGNLSFLSKPVELTLCAREKPFKIN